MSAMTWDERYAATLFAATFAIQNGHPATFEEIAEARGLPLAQVLGYFTTGGPHLQHGKRSTYLHRGCRCEPCRAAQSAYGAARRQSRPTPVTPGDEKQ